MKHFLIVASALTASTLPALAAAEKPQLSQPGPAMKDGESYYIEYSCKVTDDLPAYLKSQARRTSPGVNAATEGFAILNSGDTGVDNSFFEGGTNAIKPKLLFAVSKSMGNYTTNAPNTCKGSLIASGKDNPKLAYFLKFNQQALPDWVAGTLTTIQSLVTPIYKIASGHDLANRDAAALEQLTNVKTTYDAYLALFKSPDSTVKAVPLRVGRNTLTTGAATVVINVKRVTNGYLLDKDVPFVDQYEKLVTVKPTFAADNLENSCKILVTSLFSSGFRTAEDQAYIMYRSLGPDVIKKGKADYLACLGKSTLGPTVVKNRHLYLRNIDPDLVLSAEDLAPKPDPSETDKVVRAAIYQLTQIAGSVQKGVFAPGAFSEIANETITVNDWSGDHVTGDLEADGKPRFTSSGSAEEQFGKLISSSYTKYGCFSLTRSETSLDGDLDDATAVLLAAKPATKDAAAKTVALRLFFKGPKLSRVDITDAGLMQARNAYKTPTRSCEI